jgi:hypothetical protein
MPHIFARDWKSCDSNCCPWSVVMVCGQLKRDIQPVSRVRATVSAVMFRDRDDFRPASEAVDCSEAVTGTLGAVGELGRMAEVSVFIRCCRNMC